MRLETHPITVRSFEKDYFIDGDAFERAYKLSISGFSDYPEKLENGETRAEILARSKYLLMMSPNKWTDTQKERAAILFREYPEIEKAFSLSHSLRMTRQEWKAMELSGMPIPPRR